MNASHTDHHVDSLDHKSAKDIEQEVERTRADMDSTIDRLGRKLSPQNLLDQFLSSFSGRERSADGTEGIQSIKQAGRSVTKVVRKHPGPAALLTAGALWWAYQQASDDEPEQHFAPRDEGLSRPLTPATWRTEVPAWDDQFDWDNSSGEDASRWERRAGETLEDLEKSESQTPSAGERIRNTAARLLSLSGHKRREIHDRWNSLEEHSGSFVDARTGQPYNENYGWQWRHLMACDAVAGDYEGASDESMKDKAAECWDSVRSSINDKSLTVKQKLKRMSETVSSYAEQTGRKVKSASAQTRDSLSSMAQSTGEGLSSAGQYTRDSAVAAAGQVSNAAQSAKQSVRQGAQIAQQKTRQAMDEHPLAVGAAVLGLGLVAGLLAPSSRCEDEWMGESSDELKQNAKEAGEEAVERSKEVAAKTASAAMDEAEEQGLTPGQLAKSARETAQNVSDAVAEETAGEGPNAEGVADRVRCVAERASETAKSETERQVEKATT